MNLTENDRLNLIKDILNTHHLDGTASPSEYEQLFRSTKLLIDVASSGDVDLNTTFQAINQYSADAMNLSGYDDHLNTNKDNLQAWIQSLG